MELQELQVYELARWAIPASVKPSWTRSFKAFEGRESLKVGQGGVGHPGVR
jgi:hypothetical protein